ncbi:MAG: hypothetical protein HYU99_02615 [Deltaproteobacteria bacterium]|nr:hypothetical protein [Deltaproteobacteria bacterium]
MGEDDFCQDSEGENSGDGPDGNGLFASYELEDDVTGECDDGSSITMKAGANSAGIWRNTDDCFPEIYGTFEMGDGTIVSCHICMTESAGVSGANTSCSSGGSAVSLTSDVSCDLSTTEDEDEGGEEGDEESDCEIAECNDDFECQQAAEEAITDGNPICEDEDSVSCMTCVEECCEITE